MADNESLEELANTVDAYKANAEVVKQTPEVGYVNAVLNGVSAIGEDPSNYLNLRQNPEYKRGGMAREIAGKLEESIYETTKKNIDTILDSLDDERLQALAYNFSEGAEKLKVLEGAIREQDTSKLRELLKEDADDLYKFYVDSSTPDEVKEAAEIQLGKKQSEYIRENFYKQDEGEEPEFDKEKTIQAIKDNLGEDKQKYLMVAANYQPPKE